MNDNQLNEPVAWRDRTSGTLLHEEWLDADPLYTTPQPVTESHKRKPLTDEQIFRLLSRIDECAVRLPKGLREFAKAIEAAHGIKE